jgi:CBS domain containing-hemolysin-like protein
VEEQLYERVGENEFIIDAKIDLDEFNELVDRKLPEDGYETVGGFVYSQLDKIPTVGDTVRFQDMEFTVLATKGRRVTKIKVVRGLPPVEAESERGEEAATGEHEAQSQPTPDSYMPQPNVQPAHNP